MTTGGIASAKTLPANLPLALREGLKTPCVSRQSNPFATCWVKPGALPFHFVDGQTASQLLKRLAARNRRGAIIGPHGSGKSTLLETLKPILVAAGHELATLALRDGQRRLPSDFIERLQVIKVLSQNCRGLAHFAESAEHNVPVPFSADNFGIGLVPLRSLAQPIAIVDGYEQLAWRERIKLIRLCRRESLGLIVTSHHRASLPTLVKLAPSLTLVERLVARLCDQVSTHIAAEDVVASHACHGSNVREIFFDLYDRYERSRRNSRTSPRLFS